MKVLIVSFYYTPEMGAAPSRITNMAEGLAAEGCDVDILTCLPNYPKGHVFEGYTGCYSKKEFIRGVNVYSYWTYATVSKNPFARMLGMLFFALSIWIFGLKFWKIKHYDRVIVNSPPLLAAFSSMLLFRCIYRKCVVLNISDLWPISAIELGAVREGSMVHKVMLWMERFLYRNASAYQGQSQQIIDHIESFEFKKQHFLYRNLQPQQEVQKQDVGDRSCFRIVYAGLLGVAQDILGIIHHIHFKEIGAELHIYGGGNQAEAIQQYIKGKDCGIIFHGYQPKETINSVLGSFHASIVPLAVAITGAVPSKIFDLLPHGTPVLFAGGGEGEIIVKCHGFGLSSKPGDYDSLKNNILTLKTMPEGEYHHIRQECIKASLSDFSFYKQIKNYYHFLSQISCDTAKSE